ncbi:hypothetical protein JT358_04365 [Micrococcales bacterium 31B]|nr:hypothetical protein [Micrococcales bacterium 31B]
MHTCNNSSGGGRGLTLPLPRSVIAAAWITAALRRTSHPDIAQEMLQGTDEPHQVIGMDALNWERRVGLVPAAELPTHLVHETHDMAALIHRLRDLKDSEVLACLPRPGHPGLLPGPPPVNEAALSAGECLIVTESGRAVAALVPRVQTFGSEGDHGHYVTWRVHAAAPRPVPPPVSVRAAHHDLQSTLLRHLDELESLDFPAIARGDSLEIDHPPLWTVAELPPLGAAHLQLLTLALRLSLVTEHALTTSRVVHSASASATQDLALSRIHHAGLDALVGALRASH